MTDSASFPAPGTVLWALDVELERDVFRSGAATKPNVEYLRFLDPGPTDQEGRIPDEHRTASSCRRARASRCSSSA